MINTYRIFWAGFEATLIMTIFSYSISYALQKNFREPGILSLLVKRLFPSLTVWVCIFIGWFLHFVIGYIFVAAYSLIWENTSIQISPASGLWLGAISGIIGVLIWHITLKLHPDPPALDRPKFYLVIIAAHVVFGIVASLVY